MDPRRHAAVIGLRARKRRKSGERVPWATTSMTWFGSVMRCVCRLVAVTAACGVATSAVAEPKVGAAPGQPAADAARAYALLIGSNAGGQGQQDLKYAETDADRVAALLTELGGYERSRITVLKSPSRTELLDELDALAVELKRQAAADEPAKLIFYYSGHARAGALDLGHEEVQLRELRGRLFALDTALTLVVLDACQSGAFSGVKGAESSATFSINSVNRLSARGVAVMASSSALELSQESARLQSSYFTHHLLVGLRGAADIDAGGTVTLDEAYRYARHQTLIATAATRVGSQHVTLETDLRGKGEVVLSYPARASARLRMPEGLEGNVLIAQRDSGNVVAEVTKAADDALQIALPPGAYWVWVRERDMARRCEVHLEDARTVELAPAPCARVQLESTTAKAPASPQELWSFELGFGVGGSRVDDLGKRLTDFGFARIAPERSSLGGDGSLRAGIAVGLRLQRYLGLTVYFQNLDAGEYRRQEFIASAARTTEFSWSAYALGLGVRGLLPLLDGLLIPYAQAGGGFSLGFTAFKRVGQGSEETDQFVGYHLAVGAGLQLMPFRHVGFFMESGWVFAPAIDTLLGDSHDSGGHALRIGMRARTWTVP